MPKPPLRERLLGLLVILCIALIFYPLVFTSEEQFRIDRTSQIPARPQMDLSERQIMPVVPDVQNEPELPLFVADDALVEAVEVGETQSILSESGLPNAWLLQVGSFASVTNAEELVARLVDSGLKAYSRLQPSDGSGPDLHKVYVGPYLDRTELEAADLQLRQAHQLQPIRLQFEP